ncbi:uncharacterized protein LOC128727601 [Anopheles nili]|uniref:uncharacterized protein LOC128727601 n=1 Tax=Anopheles nili TaxID=185578 RepID=UPI00237AEE65|nr:uncharacterized protein LOC128727601 [Anopheles nili]
MPSCSSLLWMLWISDERTNRQRSLSSTVTGLVLTLNMLAVAVRTISCQEDPRSFEIRSLSGEPDYKSVNLTWEVESVHQDDGEQFALNKGRSAKLSAIVDARDRRAFKVFYCELQNWGPHRCRSKLVTDEYGIRQNNMYSLLVKNLRMATKYSFHVQPLAMKSEHQTTRSTTLSRNQGQTIIIPTKAFSAHATQCLPHASEIEVETGPFFGGRIIAENGNCGIQGDASSPQTFYTMRIDHEKCGSKVSTNDLTVETYITVQENLGILTHSTRRFVVVCTFQPDMLTVRARLALPAKGGSAAVPVPSSTAWWPENGRNARVRQFNMIDKTGLVLKQEGHSYGVESEQSELQDSDNQAVVRELSMTQTAESSAESRVNILLSVVKPTNPEEPHVTEHNHVTDRGRFLVGAELDHRYSQKHAAESDKTNGIESKSAVSSERHSSSGVVGGGHTGALSVQVFDATGLLISACLAVILIGALVYLLQRELKKQRMINQHHQIKQTASEHQVGATECDAM